MDKILATVAAITFDFLEHNPNVWVIATGSTATRTRKYQMGIAKYYRQIQDYYEVRGFNCQLDGEGNKIGHFPNWMGNWSVFEEGVNYDAFLISRIL